MKPNACVIPASQQDGFNGLSGNKFALYLQFQLFQSRAVHLDGVEAILLSSLNVLPQLCHLRPGFQLQLFPQRLETDLVLFHLSLVFLLPSGCHRFALFRPLEILLKVFDLLVLELHGCDNFVAIFLVLSDFPLKLLVRVVLEPDLLRHGRDGRSQTLLVFLESLELAVPVAKLVEVQLLCGDIISQDALDHPEDIIIVVRVGGTEVGAKPVVVAEHVLQNLLQLLKFPSAVGVALLHGSQDLFVQLGVVLNQIFFGLLQFQNFVGLGFRAVRHLGQLVLDTSQLTVVPSSNRHLTLEVGKLSGQSSIFFRDAEHHLLELCVEFFELTYSSQQVRVGRVLVVLRPPQVGSLRVDGVQRFDVGIFLAKGSLQAAANGGRNGAAFFGVARVFRCFLYSLATPASLGPTSGLRQ